MELNVQEKKALESVEYWYQLYESNPEENIDTLKKIAEGMRTSTRARYKLYFTYNIMILVLQARILLSNPDILDDEEYQKLIGYTKTDIEYYLESATKLHKYVTKCLKSNDYENFYEAYYLLIKISYILIYINTYFAEIKRINQFEVANYRYSAKIDLERVKLQEDIANTIKKLNLERDEVKDESCV